MNIFFLSWYGTGLLGCIFFLAVKGAQTTICLWNHSLNPCNRAHSKSLWQIAPFVVLCTMGGYIAGYIGFAVLVIDLFFDELLDETDKLLDEKNE